MLFDQPTTYDKLLSEVMDMLGPSLWDGSEKLFWEHQKGGEGKGNHKMLSIQISYGLDK